MLEFFVGHRGECKLLCFWSILVLDMKLAKSILEIKFSDVPELFSYKAKILKALNVSVPKNQAYITENVDIKVEDQFAHIYVTSNLIGLTIERASNKVASQFFISVLTKLEPLFRLSKSKQTGYRVIYYEDTELSFPDLVQVYKENYLKDNSLISDSVDVALPLTFKINNSRVNFMSGPMEKEQFVAGLEYPNLDSEKVHFLDLDFINSDVDYSIEAISNFIKSTQKEHEKIIAKVEELVIYG